MSIEIDDYSQSAKRYFFNQNLYLSAKENRLLKMQKEGKTVQEIAHKMHLPPVEIQKLLYDIRSKLKGTK